MNRGLHAARQNLRPGLVLWLLAVSVVVAYYLPGGARDSLEALARWKQRWGYGFAIASTALWGGIIPPLLVRTLIRDPARRPQVTPAALLFLIVFWGLKGAEVNLLYDVLARTIGEDTRVGTILTKVAIDQLLYGPLWAVPTLALAYAWKEHAFSWRKLRGGLDRRFYETTALPMLLANWGVWIPTVAAIYALPLGLQLPLQNLALCLWSSMLSVMTRSSEPLAGKGV